ncbi:MAG: prolyl oligopeptidase family serine peptidase [Planctomycetes bacterium]|nr:prolyl oligopeptidase family serine peptidase [Planctomycetota bacterium]
MKRNSFRFWHLMISIQIFCSAVVASATAQSQESRPDSQSDLAWVTAEISAPRVSFQMFDSIAAKTKVSYHIYKPAVYDQDTQRRFPVVYWLHGSGGGLPGIPRVAALFDAAIEAGKTPPCLVVFVNGLAEGMYVDWKDGSAPIETIIVKELIPHIDATYRTIASRDGRMLDGYSMGGYGSARLGFKYTDLFRAISIMGGGPLQAELIQTPRAGRLRAAEVLQKVYGGDQEYFRSVSPRRLAKENAEAITKGSLIRMVCGDQDETFSNNLAFHLHLQELAIPYTWTVLEGIDHNPMKTLESLGDSNWQFYRQAFDPAKKTPSPPRKSEVEINFQVKQQDRRAVIVNAPTDGTKRPVVIALHGGQGSAEIMRANSGFDPVAKANGFMVVYGEGTDFGGNRHAWNTGFLLRRQVKDADDIAYLDTLIDKLIQDHDADPSRIYMTGGSNGGMMTYVYAVARSERLAAVAPVVASMFTFEKKPAVPLPILMINGAKDEEVPLEGGMSRNAMVSRAQDAPYKPLKEVVQFWVEVNRSQKPELIVTQGTVTTTTYAASTKGATTEFVVDSLGAHGWPGTRARRQGTAPISAFSGAERVWEFFKDKQRTAQ